MSEFTRSINKALAGSIKSFKDFPATIACALAFMLVTMVRIHLDWQDQEQYNFLLNCLNWSLAFGALFSLMFITGAHSRRGTKRAFVFANLISIIATVSVFVLLFLFSYTTPEYNGAGTQIISSLAVARLIVGMLVSYLVFVALTALVDEKDDFPKAIFMNHKAFFIASIYGIVIIAGVSGVAGAFQALLYQDMSEKVYMYIATITGFVAFTIYVGYFPDFRKYIKDEAIEIAKKQPRFIELLFGYIMVPIMIALSVVLLLWTGQTVISGVNVNFVELSSIAAVYTILGIWLHMMVADHDTKVTTFYKKFYPVAALVILIFEARALIGQLNTTGLKSTEYWFILLWIVAVSGAVLLITLKAKAYIIVVGITCILAIVSVLPITGYNYLPAKAQVNRLEKLLIREDMLKDNAIVPASKEPSSKVKEAITDATEYLSYASDIKLPTWYNDDVIRNYKFKTVFGFDKTWPKNDSVVEYIGYQAIGLYLPAVSLDISDYNLAINLGQRFEKNQEVITASGSNGTYQIHLDANYGRNIPSFEIYLNDELIIETDMKELIDSIIDKYTFTDMEYEPGLIDDMTMIVESKEIKVLFVFSSIEISTNSQREDFDYGINLESIYIHEK